MDEENDIRVAGIVPSKDISQLRRKVLGENLAVVYEQFHSGISPIGISHGYVRPQVQQEVPTMDFPIGDFEDYPFFDINDTNGTFSGSDSYWSDMFIYWAEEAQVTEGSFLAFFADLNPQRTAESLCYNTFDKMRDLAVELGSQSA